MKWEPVKHASSLVSKYHLTEGTEVKLVLKHNLDQQSVRIGHDENQRLFFVEKSGFWSNKTLFKNEYGVEIGRLSIDRGYHAGTIELQGQRYYYGIDQTMNNRLIIYKQHISEPVISSDLPPANIEQDFTCLVLGLCWQLNYSAVFPMLEYVS